MNNVNLAKMQMLLSRIIQYPEDKLSMEDAAALTNMSYSNFCRSFKNTIGYSYVDLNRQGTPLVEIVSKPDITSPEEASSPYFHVSY